MSSGTPDVATKRLTERSDGTHLANDGVIYEEEIRYCWIDEDGSRVSPVHKDFGKALSWVSDWPQAWQRMIERENNISEGHSSNYQDREREILADLRDKLSRTGKPPRTLRRLVIRTTVESPVEHEFVTVASVLERAGLR